MPELPEMPYFPLAPDWICEVLSPSTEDFDRKTKMPLYAANGHGRSGNRTARAF
jgi:Uma2 family endonuclease